ncbi:MAG: hypothetical protein AB1640_05850 [bacterium]
MTVFYPFFLLYVFGGIAICAMAFYWAIRSGQFLEQDRARYLPLAADELRAASAATAKWPRSMVVSVVLIVCALLLQIVGVVFILLAG